MARDDDNREDNDDDDLDVSKSKKKSKGGLTDDEKLWGMLAHLGSFLVGFIAPLIIWQMKKEESEFVVKHAKESLNFQITLAIVILVGGALTCGLLAVVGGIMGTIYTILAGLAANRGEDYEYPMTIRMIN